MIRDEQDDILLALDTLCPMHCLLDAEGRIRHAGPTLRKLRPHRPMTGMRFLDLFETVQPRAIGDMRGLRAAAGVDGAH